MLDEEDEEEEEDDDDDEEEEEEEDGVVDVPEAPVELALSSVLTVGYCSDGNLGDCDEARAAVFATAASWCCMPE